MASFKIEEKLKNTSPALFSIFCIIAAFVTYSSMYAFRKPLVAATYDGLSLWGMDYKIILITTQVIGYMLSKFIGIRVISGMKHDKRVRNLFLLIGSAWLSLFFFAIVPYPYNFIFLFFNGLPLGMIWGIVFAFLEGRRTTELLGAGLSSTFIISSGLVKAVGKYLIEQHNVQDFWMPFIVGLFFVPFLILGVWLMSKIPPPDEKDVRLRTERVPMNRQERKSFFLSFVPGIIIVVIVYIALTIYRDLRDNFAVELWAALGFENNSNILVTAEIPIAISVLIITALMVLIKNNRIAFYSNIGIILFGGFVLLLMTFLFSKGITSPVFWMILTGFGLYLSYISYHTILFERWIAIFKYRSNIGFLMYIADAFGYLGSVAILFYKNFFSPELNWLSFTKSAAYIVGAITILLSLFSVLYFRYKEKVMVK
jgi:MFS family permease